MTDALQKWRQPVEIPSYSCLDHKILGTLPGRCPACAERDQLLAVVDAAVVSSCWDYVRYAELVEASLADDLPGLVPIDVAHLQRMKSEAFVLVHLRYRLLAGRA